VTDAHVPAEPAEEWLASTDEERWSSAAAWPTREEAIAGAPAELDVKPGCTFWVGRKALIDTTYPWADDIVEEAWKSDQLVPGPDSRALHGDCGTELEAR
jgi:hypothetical protein